MTICFGSFNTQDSPALLAESVSRSFLIAAPSSFRRAFYSSEILVFFVPSFFLSSFSVCRSELKEGIEDFLSRHESLKPLGFVLGERGGKTSGSSSTSLKKLEFHLLAFYFK